MTPEDIVKRVGDDLYGNTRIDGQNHFEVRQAFNKGLDLMGAALLDALREEGWLRDNVLPEWGVEVQGDVFPMLSEADALETLDMYAPEEGAVLVRRIVGEWKAVDSV
jgi:hypothetical protein